MLPQPPSYGSSARSTDNQMRNAAYSMIALMDRCQAVVKYRPNLSICSFPRVVRSVHNREYSASANLV